MATRLNALDLAFLGLETQKTPVNVASLQIFEPPADYAGHFVRDLLANLQTLPPGPPFNLRLSSTSVLTAPSWVEDDHFDLNYHVRHSALPQPGSMADLLSLVSRLHSRVMDRERPLWEFHIIEGLEGGRFAIYMKMHHAAIDGMGGIALLEACLSTEPDAPLKAPWAGLATKSRGRRSSGSLLGLPARLRRRLLGQAQMGIDLGKLLVGHGMKAVGLQPDDSPAPFTAPKTIFNVPVSGARKFGATSMPLHELKALGKATGATVNDIVLAICSGAIREYLREHKALPKRSLVASVPVSIRQINRSGNQITYVSARLATHRKTPLGRLADIGRSTRAAKKEVANVLPSASINFAVMAQGLVAVLNRLGATDLVPPPANVVISNVPGPRQLLYFAGAQLKAGYPLSVLVDGQALNITVLSYVDSVDFGVMACRDAVPDVDVLSRLLQKAFLELKAAAAANPVAEDPATEASETKPRRKRKATSRTAKKVAKKATKKASKKTRAKGARKTSNAARKKASAGSKPGADSQAARAAGSVNGTGTKKKRRKKASRKRAAPTPSAQTADGRPLKSLRQRRGAS
ncbi:MAG: wax ester/triacylglycerol synthase family O-acyltransferase [Pseudomonadota bacterium]